MLPATTTPGAWVALLAGFLTWFLFTCRLPCVSSARCDPPMAKSASLALRPHACRNCTHCSGWHTRHSWWGVEAYYPQ